MHLTLYARYFQAQAHCKQRPGMRDKILNKKNRCCLLKNAGSCYSRPENAAPIAVVLYVTAQRLNSLASHALTIVVNLNLHTKDNTA